MAIVCLDQMRGVSSNEHEEAGSVAMEADCTRIAMYSELGHDASGGHRSPHLRVAGKWLMERTGHSLR